jgi:hypothetical protein
VLDFNIALLNVVMLNVMAPKQLLALTPLATQHQLELAWCHDIQHKDNQLNDIQPSIKGSSICQAAKVIDSILQEWAR